MTRARWFLPLAGLAVALSTAGCWSGGGPAADPASSGPIVLANGQARVLGIEVVEARFQPALHALQAAVDAGDDREARAVLERLYALEPAGPALDLAHAFERILDGRAAVAALDLRLVTTFERPSGGGRLVRVAFVASARGESEIEARPGPGALHVTVTSIDASGAQSSHIDVEPLHTIRQFTVAPDRPARIDLVELPIALPAGALALRATFELELLSGSVLASAGGEALSAAARGRELPAMRWRVAPSEIVLLASELAREPLTAPADLALAAQTGRVDRRAALSSAVRLPGAQRGAALDELARISRTIPEPALSELAPALRWLATDAQLGEDPGAWRAWLRDRARALEREPDLRLPRRRASELVTTPGGGT